MSLPRTVGTVIAALLGRLVAEQRSSRSDVADLRERNARLEGLFGEFTKRDAASLLEPAVMPTSSR